MRAVPRCSQCPTRRGTRECPTQCAATRVFVVVRRWARNDRARIIRICVGSRQMWVLCHIQITRTHTKPWKGGMQASSAGALRAKRARHGAGSAATSARIPRICVGLRQMWVFCHIQITRTHTEPGNGGREWRGAWARGATREGANARGTACGGGRGTRGARARWAATRSDGERGGSGRRGRARRREATAGRGRASAGRGSRGAEARGRAASRRW